MKKNEKNNHFAKEITALVKTLEQHESVVLGDEYIIPQKPVKIPVPYKENSPRILKRSIDFNGWLPRRHWVRD